MNKIVDIGSLLDAGRWSGCQKLLVAVTALTIVVDGFDNLAMLAWTGGLINAVQITMYALAAHVYPTGIRATGVGTAVAVGRMGGVVSTYAGSWALESGGASRFFALLAATMTIVFMALASVRRHIGRNHSSRS